MCIPIGRKTYDFGKVFIQVEINSVTDVSAEVFLRDLVYPVHIRLGLKCLSVGSLYA